MLFVYGRGVFQSGPSRWPWLLDGLDSKHAPKSQQLQGLTRSWVALDCNCYLWMPVQMSLVNRTQRRRRLWNSWPIFLQQKRHCCSRVSTWSHCHISRWNCSRWTTKAHSETAGATLLTNSSFDNLIYLYSTRISIQSFGHWFSLPWYA